MLKTVVHVGSIRKALDLTLGGCLLTCATVSGRVAVATLQLQKTHSNTVVGVPQMAVHHTSRLLEHNNSLNRLITHRHKHDRSSTLVSWKQ